MIKIKIVKGLKHFSLPATCLGYISNFNFFLKKLKKYHDILFFETHSLRQSTRGQTANNAQPLAPPPPPSVHIVQHGRVHGEVLPFCIAESFQFSAKASESLPHTQI